MSWDNEKKNHSLEQLKYLLNDWLKTNNPNLNVNQDLFNATCNCILEKVVIPNYEYKDGIEYIQWTPEDNEKIMYCIQNIITQGAGEASVVNLDSKDTDKDVTKNYNQESKTNYGFYIIISILLLIIIGFCIYVYFRDIKDNDFSLDIGID